jgi:cytosine/adenosine deaminase-related metal-dependent hydrolase
MTDIKQPTDADLAQTEAVCRLALAAGIDSVEQDAAQTLALVAALREARQVVALGHEIADSYEWGECQDADQREFTNRAARIVKEAKP